MKLSEDKYSIKILLVVGLGALIRVVGASRAGIWYDEAISVTFASLGIKDIFSGFVTGIDISAPFFNLFLHFWIKLFEAYPQLVVELPSVIAGTLTIIAIYYAGQLFFSKEAGLFAALLLAFSPFHVKYSQEVRSYAFAALFVLLSFHFFYQYVFQSKKSARWGYYAFTLLAVYSHNLVILPLLAQGIFLLYQRFNRDLSREDFLSLTVPVIILYLPWIWVVSGQFGSIATNYWVGALTWQKVARFAVKLSINDGIKDKLFTLFAMLPIVFAFLCGLKSEAKQSRNLVVAYFFLPIVLLILMSIALRPLFVNRYLFFILPAYFLLLGEGISRVHSDRLRTGLLTAIILIFSVSLTFDYLNPSSPHAKFQETFFAQNYQPHDVIIYHDVENYLSGKYYANHERNIRFSRRIITESPVIPLAEQVNNRSLLAEFSRLWVVETARYEYDWGELLAVERSQIRQVFTPPSSHKGRQIKAIYLIDNK